jgi:hypothetical protein
MVKKEITTVVENNVEVIDTKNNETDNLYYNPVMDAVNKYNAQLLTPQEKITKYTSNIHIKCAHRSWETQVCAVALRNAWNCTTCKKIYNAKQK